MSGPAVCHGKANLRGTRVTMPVVLDDLAVGLSPEEIVASHPILALEDIRAAMAYAPLSCGKTQDPETCLQANMQRMGASAGS